MSIITSPEMFINMKSIPTKDSLEWKPFRREEMNKVKRGVTINGVNIPGWLYWHVNHWRIDVDAAPDSAGNIERIPSIPTLRDNDWLVGESIHTAEMDRTGLLLIGTRQMGKSEIEASYAGRRMIAFKNSQNIIAGLSSDDLGLLTSKIQRGMLSLSNIFKPSFIKQLWDKEVSLGYKTNQGSGEPVKYSELLIKNLETGKKTDKLAGPTTSSLVIDEIGKGDFLSGFIDARPALDTEFGWRCMPFFTGTSGFFEKSKDLQTLYNNLKTYNFNCVTVKDERGTHKYMPGYRSSKTKRTFVSLSTYLNKPKGSELDQIKIKIVDNIPAGIEKIIQNRNDLEKAGRISDWKKEVMFYPLTEEELFLSDDTLNIFADLKPYARDHLKYLESLDNPGESYGFMKRGSDGKPEFVTAKWNQKPIKDFPTGPNEDKNAPIIVWDRPIPGQQFGILHVSGMDPYNQDESYYSSSLGTLYVYRRMYDALNGKYQNSFVASYSARPESISVWWEQAKLLLEWYGATVLPENEDVSFIRHMDEKNLGHYVEEGIDIAKEINPGTKVRRKKGLSAATGNINYGNGLLKTYGMEDLIIGQDSQGENIVKKGIIRIKDKALLKEIIAYTPGMNVDRIVAARHALILSFSKDKFFPVADVEPQQVEKKQKPTVPHSPFIHAPSFISKGRSPFRGMKR